MVLLLLKAHAEMENVESFEFPEDHEWLIDVVIPASGETRHNVKLSRTEELEIPNSRGLANLILKVDKNVYATIKIEDIPKVTRNKITATDSESGTLVPILGVDCRGCEILAWKPTGFYSATTPTGTNFEEVDLQEGEWYDVDAETNLPVSITNIRSEIEVYRK
jgi:hypothetical protein